MGKKDITQSEILHLESSYNLTDGHAYRELSLEEAAISKDLGELFLAVDRRQQPKLEIDYLKAFFKLGQQTLDLRNTNYLFLPAASFSLEIVANYLRICGLSLALTEPCFDNLANIFKRHHISLEPLPDRLLNSPDLDNYLSHLKSDALCIVSPGNPTGECCTQASFEKILRFCKDQKRLLILDASFRAYKSKDQIFDEYAQLRNSGIDYIVIEDTGKTWPTKEIKVSVIAMSPTLFWPIYDIYTDFIYHISPVNLKLLTRFIHNSIQDKLASVKTVVQKNGQALQHAIEGTFLEPAGKTQSSVAWLKITNQITSKELVAKLAEEGVFILAGNEFFWSRPEMGDTFVRIALVRDEAIFKQATRKLRETLLAMM